MNVEGFDTPVTFIQAIIMCIKLFKELFLYFGFALAIFVSPSLLADDQNFLIMSEEFPPYNMAIKGEPDGYSVQLFKAIFKEMKLEDPSKKIMFYPWARSYQELIDKKNSILFVTTKTPSRESLFKWVGPISNSKNVILAKKTSQIKINKPSDLSKYRIGLVKSDAAGQLLRQLLSSESKFEEAPEAKINLLKLDQDKIDLFAYDLNVANWLMYKNELNPGDFEIVYDLSEGQHYFAFNKESDPKFIQKFSSAFNKVKATGLLSELKKKYSIIE